MQGDFEDKRPRSMVAFDGLCYNPYGTQKREWTYQFATVPALKQMDFCVNGEILSVRIDGKKVGKRQIQNMGQGHYVVTTAQAVDKISQVTIVGRPDIDCPGNAFFADPVRLVADTMAMPLGDWSKIGALRHYSGGMRYKKCFKLGTLKPAEKVMLDLGYVDATCEVQVNGYQAGILVSPPYSVDITELIRQGDNTIEVLVYSALSNHYATIPSPYRGLPHAGLYGPVKISVLSSHL